MKLPGVSVIVQTLAYLLILSLTSHKNISLPIGNRIDITPRHLSVLRQTERAFFKIFNKSLFLTMHFIVNLMNALVLKPDFSI